LLEAGGFIFLLVCAYFPYTFVCEFLTYLIYTCFLVYVWAGFFLESVSFCLRSFFTEFTFIGADGLTWLDYDCEALLDLTSSFFRVDLSLAFTLVETTGSFSLESNEFKQPRGFRTGLTI
jgi:hypothetical protein